MHKALSAAEACRALNSSIQVETHLEGFTPANAGGAGRLQQGVWMWVWVGSVCQKHGMSEASQGS